MITISSIESYYISINHNDDNIGIYRSFLVPVINQTNGQIPHQFIVAQIGIFIEAVEALSLELVSVGQFNVLQQVLVDLHASQNLKRVGIQEIKVFVLIARSFAGE
jgi:hypothetical protein